MAFEIKRNDRRPHYRVQLLANDVPVDITTAVATKFTMKDATSGVVKVNKETMTVIDAALGIVEHVWLAAHTDASGTYNAEVEVDWGGAVTQTFPSKGYLTITVYDDLA